MKKSIMTVCMLLIFLCTGCATFLSFFAQGGRILPSDYVPQKIIVSYRSEDTTLKGTHIHLVETEKGRLAIFEQSINGMHSLVEMRWESTKGDHFGIWVNNGPAFEYVVPKNRTMNAERYIYDYGTYKVRTIGGLKRLVPNVPKSKPDIVLIPIDGSEGSESSLLTSEEPKERKYYLKGGIGGGGVEDIPLYFWLTTGEEVMVEGGIGSHFNVEAGYNINPKLGIEVGLGSHKNSCGALENGDGYFLRVPLSVTGIYRFYREEFGNAYGGLGIACYISPELYREGLGIETTVKYDNAFGPHLLIGGDFGLGSVFMFFDLKYAFGIKYKFNEGIENGISFTTAPCPEWEEIDGSGVLFNMGFGYCF